MRVGKVVGCSFLDVVETRHCRVCSGESDKFKIEINTQKPKIVFNKIRFLIIPCCLRRAVARFYNAGKLLGADKGQTFTVPPKISTFTAAKSALWVLRLLLFKQENYVRNLGF